MSALETVLSRLPTPPRKAPARRGKTLRAFRATCPVCEGHGMPLDMAETQDGRLLLYCHAHKCEFDAVLAALGLTPADVLPDRAQAHHVPGNCGPAAAWGALAAAIDALHQAHCRLLATCSPAMKAGEIEAALRALLDAGEAMEAVKAMARRAMRESSK